MSIEKGGTALPLSQFFILHFQLRSLRTSLLDEPLPRLMAMADLWDAFIEATSSKEVADALAAHLLNTHNLRREYDGLPDAARAALDALLGSQGRMPLAAFERRFGVIRPMGPGKLERERPWLTPANAAEVLWYRGFLFRAFDNKGTPTEMAFVPNDLLGVLSVEFRVPSATPLPDQAPAQHATPDARHSILLDDVTSILCHVQNTDTRVKANGAWDAATRRALVAMLKQDDADRLQFLLHLIERAGFTRIAEGKLRLVPQPVAQWLQSPSQAQLDALFQTWLGDDTWNDLAHVPGISLQMTHTWSNHPVRERKAIVEAWQKWREEGEGWRDTPHATLHPPLNFFVTHLKATNPDFARVDGRYDTWHVRDDASGEFLQGFDNWDRVEGALIRYVIEGPVRWLSFAEEGDVRETGGQGDMVTVLPSHPVALSSTGRVTIAATHRFERFQLARVADWVATDGDVFVYVLSPRSLARAREQGIQAARVVEFLEKTTNKPLPDGVKRAITRWSERGVEARLEPMVILKTQDAAAMEALLRIQDVRRVVVDRFAPNCISIRPRDAEAVRAAILESGVMVEGVW